jgi:hypothetical protein
MGKEPAVPGQELRVAAETLIAQKTNSNFGSLAKVLTENNNESRGVPLSALAEGECMSTVKRIVGELKKEGDDVEKRLSGLMSQSLLLLVRTSGNKRLVNLPSCKPRHGRRLRPHRASGGH